MIKKIYLTWLSCLVIALCLLSGCSQLPTTTAPSYRLNQPELKKPEYHKIANNYLKQALQATKNVDIQEFKLKAAENFILAEEINSAIELSNNIEITNQNHEAYLYILKAQIALQKKQADLAKQNLQNISTPKQLPSELQTKFYQTRADLYLRTENPVEAAKDNIELEQHLTTIAEKNYKNKEILTILSKLTPSALQESQQNCDDENLNGWLSFTHIMKQYDTNPEQMTRAIAVWRNNYPNHQANNMIPTQEKQMNEDDDNPIDLPQPKRIALLLPLKGPYAASAEIIRDGFLAAHYEHVKTDNSKTEVHIYNTATNKGATQAYNNAIDEQADFIVGPLIKDDIENLIAISDRNIPVLALNTTTIHSHAHYSNLFQFGLLPETDATELVEQIWHDGHRKVLIIVPIGNWGDRVAVAFRDRFQQYSGKILAIEKIAPHEDLSQKMRRILGATHRSIEKIRPKVKNQTQQKARYRCDHYCYKSNACAPIKAFTKFLLRKRYSSLCTFFDI